MSNSWSLAIATTTTSPSISKEADILVTNANVNGHIASFGPTSTSVTDSPKLQNEEPESLRLNKTVPTEKNPGEILGTAAAYKLDVREPLIGCSLSEFACTNGQCIPSSKYCDRINDCHDNSDEPRFCTRKYINNNT